MNSGDTRPATVNSKPSATPNLPSSEPPGVGAAGVAGVRCCDALKAAGTQGTAALSMRQNLPKPTQRGQKLLSPDHNSIIIWGNIDLAQGEKSASCLLSPHVLHPESALMPQ